VAWKTVRLWLPEDKIKLIWGLEEVKAVAYGCLPSPARKN